MELVGRVDACVTEIVHRRPVLGLTRQKADLNPNYEAVAPLAIDQWLGRNQKVVLMRLPADESYISSGDTLARRANPARIAAVLERAETSRLDLLTRSAYIVPASVDRWDWRGSLSA
jgi:hypothetical protein